MKTYLMFGIFALFLFMCAGAGMAAETAYSVATPYKYNLTATSSINLNFASIATSFNVSNEPTNTSVKITYLNFSLFNSYHLLNASANKGYLTQASLPYTLTIAAGESWELDGDTCVVPFEDYTVNISTTFCPGTYNLNDTNGNGAIIVNKNNVTLDCNGATMFGIRKPNSIGINNVGVTNDTVKNCNVGNYQVGMKVVSWNLNNNFYNNILFNNSLYSMQINGQKNGVSSNDIRNNTLSCWNNSFTTLSSGIILQSGTNHTIYSNSIRDCTYGIRFTNSNNTYVVGNYVYNTTASVLIQNSYNDIFTDNIFNLSDSSFKAVNYSNGLLRNNTILQAWLTNMDGYYSGIVLDYGTHNLTIINNTIEFGTGGVLVRRSSEISITNNSFKQLNVNDKASLGVYEREPSFAIGLLELYQGYTGDAGETSADTIAKISQYASYNVNISGNVFDTNVQTYLQTQGSYSVIHDLTGFWTWTVEAPKGLVNATQYYNNPSFNALSANMNLNINVSNTMLIGYPGLVSSASKRFNFSMSKTLLTYTCMNDTPQNISVFNLSSPNNDILNVSNNVIIGINQPSWTQTLSPGQQIQVGSFDPTVTCDGQTITANVLDGNYNVTYTGYDTGTYSTVPIGNNCVTDINGSSGLLVVITLIGLFMILTEFVLLRISF